MTNPSAQAAPADAAPSGKPGRLFYVVGPSGVGKDALLQWVRTKIESSGAQVGAGPAVVFARRTITRAAHPSEDHEPIDAERFLAQAKAGQFILHWHANGAAYGIRRGIVADLAAGRQVVVNGSREHVPILQKAFPDATVVWITADPDTVARRLASRGREIGNALQERIARGTRLAVPSQPQIVEIDNSGPLGVAGAQLLALILRG